MRYNLKKDKTHRGIARELTAHGFSVLDLSRVGEGCPDMLISKYNVAALLEAKTPELSKRTGTPLQAAVGKLEQSQKDFASLWKGPIIVAYSASEAIHEFRMLLKRREAYAD
ncbi:MAG: hypothetical protein RB191_12845 [Terriglobia bacterium]|nr:hypothetical protein [Terriglobia bacterium]